MSPPCLARALGAVGGEGHPYFQRAEAAGEIGAKIARPGRTAGQAARGGGEVVRGLGEGGQFDARGRAPARSRNRKSPAPIYGNRKRRNRLAQCRRSRASAGRKHGQRAEGAIDMEPGAFLPRRCRRGSSRSSNAPTSTVPAVPTMRNGVQPAALSAAMAARKRRNIHLEIFIHRDAAKRAAAEAPPCPARRARSDARRPRHRR